MQRPRRTQPADLPASSCSFGAPCGGGSSCDVPSGLCCFPSAAVGCCEPAQVCGSTWCVLPAARSCRRLLHRIACARLALLAVANRGSDHCLLLQVAGYAYSGSMKRAAADSTR